MPLIVALALLIALAAPPAAAGGQAFPGTSVQTLGGAPNGPSRNPAISQDRRYGRMVAFESGATNLAGGGGATDVFVIERAPGYGEDGTPWRPGRTILASRGLGGAAANGPSTRPSLSGTSRIAPRCVAFVSAASNLVANDTNGRPDAFVHDLRTGRTRRVSVDSRGRQSSGTVSEVQVDGECSRVAFVSDGGDLALTRTRNRSWRSARTRATPAGRRQVYLRAIGGDTGIDRALKGLTFLASATDGGRPSPGDSHSIAFSTNNRALTYATEGALTSGDTNGTTDVYQRVMTRAYGRRIRGRSVQYLRMDTRLVSPGTGGASSDPASNVDGTVVAFTTRSAAAIGGGAAQPQVVQADLTGPRPRYRLASRSSSGGPGNGASVSPSVSAGGSWVVFASQAADVGVMTNRRPDTNGVADIQLFTQASGERWILGERGATSPAANPMTSPHGNYVVFERAGQTHLVYVGPK